MKTKRTAKEIGWMWIDVMVGLVCIAMVTAPLWLR